MIQRYHNVSIIVCVSVEMTDAKRHFYQISIMLSKPLLLMKND